uniref:Uncharacterized protein n=1 Tax=Microcebus murinus TaxID=30608 RepID=A0A8C5VFR0_MICMU
MAASGESGTSGGKGRKRDSALTSKNQIERLTRPGSSYFKFNPLEVLQIDPEVTDEEIKKRFRQLSILDSCFPPTSTPTWSSICFPAHFVFNTI